MTEVQPPTEGAVDLRGSARQAPVRDLVRDAVDEAGQLVQSEIRLARREIQDSLRAAIGVAVAGALAVFGVIAFLVMAIVTIVAATEPRWAAALGFALLFLVVAAGGGLYAMRAVRRIAPLQQTVETIKEDVEWAKQQLKPDAR